MDRRREDQRGPLPVRTVGAGPSKRGLLGVRPRLTAIEFLVVSSTSLLCADTVTVDVRPTKDAFVGTQDVSANYGSATTLYAGTRSDPKLGLLTHRTLIEFDVAGSLPPGAEIESASLLLYQSTSAGGASATMLAYVFPIAASWEESKVAWENQQAVSTSLTAKLAPGEDVGIKTWDVTPIVKAWLSGAKPNGPTDDVIFHETQWIRIFRVGRSAGTGRITGRVLDPDGALVSGALVELTSMPDVAAVRTDGAGAFAFDAIPAEGCRPIPVEAARTSSRDLELEPPGRNRRLVTIHGLGRIRDDEDPFSDVVRDREIFEEIHLDPENDSASVDIAPRCVGGEVRFVMTLSLDLGADFSVRVTGAAFLYEIYDCDRRDLADMTDIGVDISEDDITTIHVSLENGGAGGGDTADFDIDFMNYRT